MNVPSMVSRTNQMRVYDLRLTPTTSGVLSFGCTENVNGSPYLRPDWKPDAWIVSSGNMTDHKIHIWYNNGEHNGQLRITHAYYCIAGICATKMLLKAVHPIAGMVTVSSTLIGNSNTTDRND
jgi:hypothetical protein